MGEVRGVDVGRERCKAAAEGYAAEFFRGRGGVEEAARRAAEVLGGEGREGPGVGVGVRDSQIFLGIVGVIRRVEGTEKDAEKDAGAQKDAEIETDAEATNTDTDTDTDFEFLFTIHLHDPIHGISFPCTSQPIPHQWIRWLDAPNDALPSSIQDIIEGGGVDPREWVSEWVEETLSLSVGVVAQRYVARRMGVGEAVRGKGVARLRAEMGTGRVGESGGGEAARAGLI